MIARKYDTEERIEIAKLCTEQIVEYIDNIQNKKIIDLGRGTGLVGLNFANRKIDVLVVDVSE